MQQLTDKSGAVRYILDGAHNSHAVRRLVETLRDYYPGVRFHCVFGALKDKDVGEMLKLMAPYVSHWHITKTPYPRFSTLLELELPRLLAPDLPSNCYSIQFFILSSFQLLPLIS